MVSERINPDHRRKGLSKARVAKKEDCPQKGGNMMNMQENFRLIEALQSAGWSAEQIINLIKYVESGEEQYKPKKED